MSKLAIYLAVFTGGALGSILREAFSISLPGLPFLTATFGINILACFILGGLYAQRRRLHPHWLHLGAVGFCGGLSTFSAFMAEIYRLGQTQLWLGLTAPAFEIAFGLGAAMLGGWAAQKLWREEPAP
ncbi:MAG: CrcB family protein [Mangrovicoccus sp.]|nr:CrcB family protein [Mangrovicoccus sp.]